MSNSLQPHGLQDTSSPVHYFAESVQTQAHWVGDAIQPSHSLSSPSPPPSIFPSIRVFPMSQFFTSGGQSSGVSASASVLPMNIQDWFPLGWTGSISLQSKRLSESSPTPQFKSINSLALRLLYGPVSHPYMTTGKTITLTRWTFVGRVMSLLFNTVSRFVIAFLPKSNRLEFHGCYHHRSWF